MTQIVSQAYLYSLLPCLILLFWQHQGALLLPFGEGHVNSVLLKGYATHNLINMFEKKDH